LYLVRWAWPIASWGKISCWKKVRDNQLWQPTISSNLDLGI
jgi:hypothetical protein